MDFWRVCHPDHLASAFSGDGARLYGGRWNSAGVPVVYTSEELSLAVMEVLVHLDLTLPVGPFLAIRAVLPVGAPIAEVTGDGLPSGWRDSPSDQRQRRIGDEWFAQGHHLALLVPSAVLPLKRNLLLNPTHPSFSEVTFDQPRTFYFDRRLIFRFAE